MNRALVRSVAAGVLGFLAYGSWAFWVNMEHGTDIGARAGLVQGSWSFVLTLTMTLVMEWLLRVTAPTGAPGVVTLVITVACLFGGSWSVNWLAGTPDILLTILPGFLIGSGYSTAYIWAHRRLSQRRQAETCDSSYGH